MSSNTKTLGKRKLLNKSLDNTSNIKMLNKSISKTLTPGTPKQTKLVSKISSEQKQNSEKVNKKRKSLPANLANGSDDILSKKSKLEPFSGTSDLFLQMKKTPKNENKDVEKGTQGKSNKSDVTDGDNQESSIKSKRKLRKEKARALRAAAKERFKETIGNATLGEGVALSYVKNKIEELEKKKELSNASKRKLKLFKRALKNSKTAGESSSQNLDKGVKQKSNATKQNTFKKNKNKNKIKENKLAIPQIETKEDADIESEGESKEEEYESSDDNQASDLIEKENIEKDDDDDVDEDDEDEDDEDEDDEDEGDEDEDDVDEEDSDEKEEESGSDDNEITNTIVEVPNKKNHTQVSKQQDIPKMNLSTGNQSQFTLFVGNVPYDVTQEEIAEHFSKAGNVKDIRIPLDKKTNKSRGFAYVDLENNTSYQKALSLNQTTLKGRKLNIKDAGDKKGKNVQLHPVKQGGKPFGNFKGPQKGFAKRQGRQSK